EPAPAEIGEALRDGAQRPLDRANHPTVGHDEHVAGAAPVDGGRQPRARTREQLVVALEVGRRAPRREVAGPALLDLVAGQAAPRAHIPLTKTRLLAYLCDAEMLCDQVARAPSPDEVRRPHRSDGRNLGEPRPGILGLTLPERREG